MKRFFRLSRVSAAAVVLAGAALPAVAQELTTNGDFENGTTSGWTSFVNPPSTFTTTADASDGLFGGFINNVTPGSGQVIKQANIGIGVVNPGDVLNVSFDAKGEFGVGGVAFAEFFSELSGGGTSKAEILSGGPLPLSDTFQTFMYTVTAGPDVSGGVTLQFNAATGAVAGSFAQLTIDNVSVSPVPEPASLALLGLGGLCLATRRGRRTA